MKPFEMMDDVVEKLCISAMSEVAADLLEVSGGDESPLAAVTIYCRARTMARFYQLMADAIATGAPMLDGVESLSDRFISTAEDMFEKRQEEVSTAGSHPVFIFAKDTGAN